MRCTSIVSVLSVVALAPSAFGAEYLVGVGKDETTGKKGVGFDPSVIHPQVGDVIAFEFRSGKHSVVQSTFGYPCQALLGGIDTGVQTVDDNLPVDAPGLPQIRVTVNNTDPIWFFDEAGGQCKNGGVLAVNPSDTQTAAAFKDNAAKAVDGPAPSSSSSAGPSDTGSSSGSSATQTSPSPSTTSNAAMPMAGERSALVLAALALVASIF